MTHDEARITNLLEDRNKWRHRKDWPIVNKITTVSAIRRVILSFYHYELPEVNGVFPALLQSDTITHCDSLTILI